MNFSFMLCQASVSLARWDLFFVSEVQKFKRFQNVIFHSTFKFQVQLWRTAQRLVIHMSPSQKLAKKDQRISDFFGMVSV